MQVVDYSFIVRAVDTGKYRTECQQIGSVRIRSIERQRLDEEKFFIHFVSSSSSNADLRARHHVKIAHQIVECIKVSREKHFKVYFRRSREKTN